MSADLGSRIAEAQAASATIAEQDRLRALAEELPELEREGRRREQLAIARQNFELAKSETVSVIRDSGQRARDLTARIEAAVSDLTKLSAGSTQLEQELASAQARLLQSGAQVVLYSEPPEHESELTLSQNPGLLVWQQIAGGEPAFDALRNAVFFSRDKLRFVLR